MSNEQPQPQQQQPDAADFQKDAAPSKNNNRSNSNNNNNNNNRQKRNTHAPKRGPIINMKKYLNTEVIATVTRGREIRGTLIGYDFWMNMVLENATIITPGFIMRKDSSEPKTEKVSKVVVLGRLLLSFEPIDGYEVITNPDFQPEAVI